MIRLAPAIFLFTFALATAATSHGATAEEAAAQEPVPVDDEPRHRVVFENPNFRFFDVQLPAGYRTVWHTHSEDGVFINISPALTEAQNWGEKPVLRAPRRVGEAYYIGYGTNSGSHRVTNADRSDYRVIDAEIRSGCSDTITPAEDPTQALILENERVRVTRVTLAPGATANLPSHCNLLVVVEGSELVYYNAYGAERTFAKPATFRWRRSAYPMTITNVGNRTLHAVDVYIKK